MLHILVREWLVPPVLPRIPLAQITFQFHHSGMHKLYIIKLWVYIFHFHMYVFTTGTRHYIHISFPIHTLSFIAIFFTNIMKFYLCWRSSFVTNGSRKESALELKCQLILSIISLCWIYLNFSIIFLKQITLFYNIVISVFIDHIYAGIEILE